MKSKTKKQNDKVYIIVSLFVVMLTLVVGYAIFSETLNITGTAVTSGDFDVEFSATSVTSSSGCTPTSTVSGDKNGISISIPDLSYPGSTATISVTVKNTGNIGANLLDVNVTGNSDPDVNVTYPTFATGTVLAAGATYTFDIVVTWAADSNNADKNVNFSVGLDYEQSI